MPLFSQTAHGLCLLYYVRKAMYLVDFLILGLTFPLPGSGIPGT